jgi:inhibitor of cysteine peptidase
MPIEVEVGQEFAITLRSNPTTGYQWQLVDLSDADIVKLVGSEYKGPEAERVGAGGEEVWSFQATGQGETSVSLVYVRPWEKDVPPAEARTFTVLVREP